jgi:hypothetical protein
MFRKLAPDIQKAVEKRPGVPDLTKEAGVWRFGTCVLARPRGAPERGMKNERNIGEVIPMLTD